MTQSQDRLVERSDASADGELLIRGGVLRIGAFLGMIGLSVVYTVILTRYLGVTRFGQYTTALSVATLVATVTDQGMANYAAREYAVLRGAARDQRMSDIFGLRVTLTLIGLLVSVGFAVGVGYRGSLVLGLGAASLATLPLVVMHTLSIPLINRLRLGTLASLELARQAVWTAGIVTMVVVKAGLFPLLLMLLVANGALIVPTWWLTRGTETIRATLRPHSWPLLANETLLFSLATGVGTLYVYLAQVLTSLIASPVQSGLFSVSFRVFLVTGGIPALVGGSALPVLSRAARDDQHRLSYIVRRFIEISLIAGAGIALIMSAASHFIVTLVAGGRFHAAAPVLEIQAFAIIATFLTAPCSFGLMSLRCYRQMLLANAGALIVTLLATVVLASADGARGAAVATICGELTVALLMLSALVWNRVDYRLEPRFMLKLGFATLCSAPFAVLPGIPSLPRIIATAAVYAVIVIITRVVPREVIETFWRRRSSPH